MADEFEYSGEEWLSRSELLLGNASLGRLKQSHVLVVGLGGVGAYAAELVCRAGVGRMTIADGDVVACSNRNRQLPALASTEGESKAELVAARLRDINPVIELTVLHKFIKNEETDILLANHFDYVIDAIDTLSPKVALLAMCHARGLRTVSSMGAGGKLDPMQVKISDMAKSFNCKLAKAIRKRLHRRDIRTGIKVVFSSEEVSRDVIFSFDEELIGKGGSITGTISYMPAIFGCCCASVVIRDLIEEKYVETG
jgi:tRNA threonylcarbamoyladenosine dehydratase